MTPDSNFCTNCGAQAVGRYCSQCGAQLHEAEQSRGKAEQPGGSPRTSTRNLKRSARAEGFPTREGILGYIHSHWFVLNIWQRWVIVLLIGLVVLVAIVAVVGGGSDRDDPISAAALNEGDPGTYILFFSDMDRQEGFADIYATDIGGRGQVRLTHSSPRRSSVGPVWSADGTRILFASQIFEHQGNDFANMWAMNPDGTDLTHISTARANHHNFAWSPDGSMILFQESDRNGYHWSEIYVMQSDGSNVVRLTNNPANDWRPSWSPNGDEVLFHSNRAGKSEIYKVRIDGSNLVQLTVNDARDDYAVWSPDGTKIAFVSHRDGNGEIYLMNPDGSDQLNLTNSPYDEGEPAWSPDGRQIVFKSAFNIFMKDSDGSNGQRLRGTAVAQHQVRGGVPEGIPKWD